MKNITRIMLSSDQKGAHRENVDLRHLSATVSEGEKQ